ncbi:RNase H [Sporomusaceae bacterium FL31]|nr:RNase H [Sporomusaceae bacterium FL31]GCE33588.1 RNase H [Sporomusaceae bacterium]
MVIKKKYYGVKVGRVPGVYQTWDECKKQVIGYPGALYKGFASLQEVQEYVSGALLSGSSATDDTDPTYPGRYYDIYVDGSYVNKQYSWAFVVYDGTQIIHTGSGLGKDTEAAAIHNVAGELEAAVQAMQWSDEQDVDYVIIHHDYIGISEWATGKWKTNNQFTKAYAQFASKYLHKVKFNKVSGHTGIEGNELADKLARGALKSNNDC